MVSIVFSEPESSEVIPAIPVWSSPFLLIVGREAMLDDVWPRSRHHQRNDAALRLVADDVATAREMAWLVLKAARINRFAITPLAVEMALHYSPRLVQLFWTYFFVFLIEHILIEDRKRKP